MDADAVSGVRTQANRLALSGAERRRWIGAAAVVTTAHLALGVGLASGLFASPPVKGPSVKHAMMADIVSLPAMPPMPQADMPPGPKQVEQRVQPEPVRDVRPFDPPPEVPGPPPPGALATRVTEVPSEPIRKPVDHTTAPPAVAAPPAETVTAAVKGASSSGAAAERTWEGDLLAHLERLKRYPVSAQTRRQEDRVYVRFVIDRTGRVLESTLARKSRHFLLNEEAGALLRRASPLPPPPPEVPGGAITMVVPINFYLR